MTTYLMCGKSGFSPGFHLFVRTLFCHLDLQNSLMGVSGCVPGDHPLPLESDYVIIDANSSEILRNPRGSGARVVTIPVLISFRPPVAQFGKLRSSETKPGRHGLERGYLLDK
jgi:hypothetical protein